MHAAFDRSGIVEHGSVAVKSLAFNPDASLAPPAATGGDERTPSANENPAFPTNNGEKRGFSNGARGIRTPETPKGLPVFKTGAFNRSAIAPNDDAWDSPRRCNTRTPNR